MPKKQKRRKMKEANVATHLHTPENVLDLERQAERVTERESEQDRRREREGEREAASL